MRGTGVRVVRGCGPASFGDARGGLRCVRDPSAMHSRLGATIPIPIAKCKSLRHYFWIRTQSPTRGLVHATLYYATRSSLEYGIARAARRDYG